MARGKLKFFFTMSFTAAMVYAEIATFALIKYPLSREFHLTESFLATFPHY